MEVRQGPSSNEFSQDQSTSKLPYSSAFEANFATYQSLALLVKLPGHGWMWSFDNTVRPTIFCTNVNILPNGKMLVRSLQVLKAQTVEYYFNGKQIPSNDLARSFSSIEELSELVVAFERKTPCVGIADPKLHNVKMSSRLSCVWDIDGALRSTKCSSVAGKVNLCGMCRLLKTYLRKRSKDGKNLIPTARSKFRCCSSTQKKQSQLDGCRRRIKVLESRVKVRTFSTAVVSLFVVT